MGNFFRIVQLHYLIMTIFTKAPTDEKKDVEAKKLDDTDNGKSIIIGDTKAALYDDTLNSNRRLTAAEWYYSLRRRRLLTSLCATLLILWLLLAAVAGAILLYKYLHRKPVYYGWCGADYVDQDNMKSAKLEERVEVDQENDFEKIEVPQFGAYRPSTFIHDFKQNLTAIIDVWGQQCFIKPLDRRQTAPPSGFIDLVKKVESGYYEQNADIIRQRFTVRLPALTYEELRDLGSWVITHQCARVKSYMLDRTVRSKSMERSRRSDGKGHAKKCPSLKFAFYNAKGNVIQDSIESCFN